MRALIGSMVSDTRFVMQKASVLLSIVPLLMLIFFSKVTFAEKIILAAAENSIPTSYLENRVQKGILVDVIHEAFNRAGHSVEIILMPWARCQREVKNGIADGIFSIFITPERQTFLTYADEVLITQVQAFFVPVQSKVTFDGDLTKLADKSIGVINQTSYGPILDVALKTGVFKAVSYAQSSESNVRKLIAGRTDLIPSYRHIALSTAKALGKADQIKQLTPNVEAIPSYLAFTKRKDFTSVISDFNRALIAMKKDGKYDEIFNSYLH